MKNRNVLFLTRFFIAIYLLINVLLLSAQEMNTLQRSVKNILSKFPAESSEVRDRLAGELMALGKGPITEICTMLVSPGTGDDTNARFALNALATFVGRSDTGDDRKIIENCILNALEAAKDDEVRAFLIRQLQWVGKNASVKPLSAYLKDVRLCEPATQALLSIRSPDLEKILIKAMGSAEEENLVTIIRALGELRSQSATKKLFKYVDSPDKEVRRVTLDALANTGDPSAQAILSKSRVTDSPYDRATAPSLYLLFAQRLAEAGDRATGVRICRSMIRAYAASSESHIACTALGILIDVLEGDALEDLLAAMEVPNDNFQAAALALADRIPGDTATAEWIATMKEAEPVTRANIIAMLGRRGDGAALRAVLPSLKDEEKTVRMAAIPAVVKLGSTEVVSELIHAMGEAQDTDEIELIRILLLTLPTEAVVNASAHAIPTIPPPARKALLEILAARKARSHVEVVWEQSHSHDQGVKIAAIKALKSLVTDEDLPRLIEILEKAESLGVISAAQNTMVESANQIPDLEKRGDLILATLAKTEGKKRIRFIESLARIGGREALNVVVTETRQKDTEVRNAAIRTLVNWPDFQAAPYLFQLAQRIKNSDHQSMILRGLVRLIVESEITEAGKLSMLKKAMPVAINSQNKALVMNGFSNFKTLQSLEHVAAFLEDHDLKVHAARIAKNIVLPDRRRGGGLSGFEVTKILKKAMVTLQDDSERESVKDYLDTLGFGKGFTPLFNGRDLSGWKGLVGDPVSRAKMTPDELKTAQTEADEDMWAHWKAVNDILVFDGKGHSLCTAKDYRDFEMFVDWKIEKLGDSGLYLRGSPQVQIWDPAQWPEGSGGLYNNRKHPNKPLQSVDNPIGDWNTFRIKMIGERVTVYLNDVLVVENVVMENYWERDKPIYPYGQIELQAHSTPLYFRNIYIREISEDEAAAVLTEDEISEGYLTLFNGIDLNGWTGDKKGYSAEEGKIVIYPERGSGNLYTENMYGDFIFRFEFKLTPGANNGLGIRTPSQGDAAYVGMELQILDNTSPKYSELKPYQYHGSIYGVVPAEQGHLKPLGQWNTEEVIADGKQITVKLNGVAIVDANIDEVIESGTMDGRSHPGLKREEGHIGFLGHGSRVEFRNIRIKETK